MKSPGFGECLKRPDFYPETFEWEPCNKLFVVVCGSDGELSGSMLDFRETLRKMVTMLNRMTSTATTTTVSNSVAETKGNTIATVCDAMLSVFSYWPRSSYWVGSAEDVTQFTDAMHSLEQTLQAATGNAEVLSYWNFVYSVL